MPKVLSDTYIAADAGRVTMLSLLDLSAAFDTVDHQIQIERMRSTYGLSARALDWISSYLSGRMQFVHYNGETSDVMPVTSGVPQGSVLGPVLFILYAIDVTKLAENAGFSVHAYTDNLQIYGHADPSQSTQLMADIADCITSVETWMASNQLRLNLAKTDVIWLGTSRQVQQCTTDPLQLQAAWRLHSAI